MLVCDQQDHDNEEIVSVCLNLNCLEKRACCMHCIEKHQSHKKELKNINKLSSWQKEFCQNYQAFTQLMDKILYTIKSTEQYLSDLFVDPEISFKELRIDEFEDYISKLIKIQQISLPFNKILSELSPQLEPLNQFLQNNHNFLQTAQFDEKLIIFKSKNKNIIPRQQYQEQTIQTDEYQKQIETNIRMKQYIYQELLEKTNKIRRQNELDIHQYPTLHKIQLNNLDQYKTIILIGTSQSGKQQLINLFLNYYQGVEFQDPYRFEMIDDIDILKQKQNDEYDQMKVYYITPQNRNPGLRIIFTPDYSENLIYEDQIIEEKIYNLLKHTVSLNQCIIIGFVITKNIGISQYFMLESILSKFSNNLINNIVFLFPDSTLDSPIQKEILLSKTHLNNEIQSPVMKMIPTINNSWYLKFSISTLFIQNNQTNNQDNKQLWEMGKNCFYELINKQLQYKFNLKNLDQMRNYYYNSFLLTFNVYLNASECINQFYKLYQSETFGYRELKEVAEDLNTLIKENINTQNRYSGDYQYYELKNGPYYLQLINNLKQGLIQQDQLIDNYCYMIKDYSKYNKQFEEFSKQLKQYINDQPQQLIKIISEHTQYFQFNSILNSINSYQYNYYNHLIKVEEKHKQEGWERRCQILKKRYSFFYYIDNYIRGSNQLIQQKQVDFQFERKRHPDAEDWCGDGAIVYYQIAEDFISGDIRTQDGIVYVKKTKDDVYIQIKRRYINCYYTLNNSPYEIQNLSSIFCKQDYTELIYPRISDDCDKQFQEYLYHEADWE